MLYSIFPNWSKPMVFTDLMLEPGPAPIYPCPVSIFDQLPVDNVLYEAVVHGGNSLVSSDKKKVFLTVS